MASYSDLEHRRARFLRDMEVRGQVMEDLGKNRVANATPLLKWSHKDMHCELLPDDRDGVLRISIGGGDELPVRDDYCRVRGDIGKCIALMEQAIIALRHHPS